MRTLVRLQQVVGLAVVGLILAACSGATPAAPGQANGGQSTASSPIKIGYMADSNGTSAPIAAGMHLGTDLAVQQINGAGGINGHPLQVQYVDPQSDPTQAVQMATELVQNDKVDVLMGAVLSSECLVVQQLVAKLQVVYLPTFGCAAEEFSSQFCNRYSFRFEPVGRQQIAPLAEYIVKTYGPKWAMAYSDYAYGVSQLNAYTAELGKYGGSVVLPIPIPQNEPNLAPYVTKVPTDGSVNGVIINGLGAGDLTRFSLALGQYGVAPKVKVVGFSGRDVYGGTYPEFLTDAVNYQTFLSGQPKGNTNADAYEKAFRDIAAKEPEWANILGGADKILGFEGYLQYTAMTALKTAMINAKFTGRGDSEALITALESVNIPLGPDAPGGAIVMNKGDHQGAQTTYVFRINGQEDELLNTVPAEQIPPLGNCKANP